MTNIDLIRALYGAFADRDDARLREILHPDVEWIQCAGFPGGGRYVGAEAVLRDVFSALRDTWEAWQADVESFLDAGATVVVLGTYSGTHAVTRRSMTSVFAHVYDIDDARVVRFRQIADTQPMADAATASGGE